MWYPKTKFYKILEYICPKGRIPGIILMKFLGFMGSSMFG